MSAWTAVSLAGCASARPEIAPPRPRGSLETPPEATTRPADEQRPLPVATVSGEIRFLGPAEEPPDLGPVVVYLAPRNAAARESSRAATDAPPLRIVSGGMSFEPGLAAVPAGRSITLSNDGPLNHRLFAPDLGRDRAFDLPPGTRSAPFRLPPIGPVRFFCSLHADETFVVFAQRTPYVEVVEARERFSFGPVGPGRYSLSIWSERVEGPVRDVVVDGYSRLDEPIWIDPRLVRPATLDRRGRR